MRPRLVPSRRLALLFVLALGALLGVVLAWPSARVPLRTPLVPRAARSAPVTVSLEARPTPRASQIHRLELVGRSALEVLAHEELQLFLESATLRLVAARIRLRGEDCELVASGRAELSARQATVFRRSAECQPHAAEGPAALDLEVEVKGDGPVSLLAFLPAPDADQAPLQVAPTRSHPQALDVRGAFVDYPPRLPRIVLLNHMWRIAPGFGWLIALVALGVLLAVAGVLVFPTRPVTPAWPLPDGPTLLRASIAAGLCGASLAVLHSVLEPPLSGPDEPYHLLGFAELVGDAALARDTVVWMGETHLWRIRQQPAERFRSIDVGRPYVVADDQLRPTEVAMRSAIVTRLWQMAAPLARGEPAPRALLALRLVNALVFALAVGAAVALALTLVAEPFPQWLAYPFLLVPALPFFAMHVSETAVLCAVYVLLGTSVAVIVLDGPRAHWAGPPLGLATGLMLAGGRSPWPLAALVAVVLLGRVALGTRGSRRGTRSALVFWGGFGLAASVFFVVLDDAYRAMTEMYAVHYTQFVPDTLRSVTLWLLAQPVSALGLAAVGAGLERALAGVRARFALRLDARARVFVARAGTVLAVAVWLSLAASLLVDYPQLPIEPRQPLAAPERLATALAATATMFRLTGPDYLLASSFWVGFGWLDTMPGPALQGLLTALTGASLAVLLATVARRRQVRRFVWLVAVATGALLALAVYTLSTQDRVTALVGRYLIGWYLCVLPVCGSALVFDRRGTPASGHPLEPAGGARAALLLVVAGCVHTYCLAFILARYF